VPTPGAPNRQVDARGAGIHLRKDVIVKKTENKTPKLVELGSARRETRGMVTGPNRELDGIRPYP
jgi:hypothetical protein